MGTCFIKRPKQALKARNMIDYVKFKNSHLKLQKNSNLVSVVYNGLGAHSQIYV